MNDARNALSARRVVVLLALTALPVVATSAVYRFARPPDLAWLRPIYVNFIVYALANWMTFALVVSVAGWPALRACGLRVRLSLRRIAAACVAVVAAVTIYDVVSIALRRWNLPPVGGMGFDHPTAVEAVSLFASAVVSAAFCEEVFFRVLWIGAARRHVPIALAAPASIAAFAAIHFPHFGIGGVIFISAWAILPITLFLACGDFSTPLLLHLMNNTFAYIIVPLFLQP